MNTSTLRGYGHSPGRRSNPANEPIFRLVHQHPAQPPQQFDDEVVDVDVEDGVPGLRPAWWRRALSYLLFVGALAGAGALLTREEPRKEILRWATFGHPDKAQQLVRSLRSAVDPDSAKSDSP